MHYYFHLVHGQEIIRDEHGLDIAYPHSLEAAATNAVTEIAREGDLDSQFDEWRLQITDHAGAVLCVLSFGDILAKLEA